MKKNTFKNVNDLYKHLTKNIDSVAREALKGEVIEFVCPQCENSIKTKVNSNGYGHCPECNVDIKIKFENK